MAFEKILTRTNFVMKGTGRLGLHGQFDFYRAQENFGPTGDPIFTLMLVRTQSGGLKRFEVTAVSAEGAELFSMAAKPALGGKKVLVTSFSTTNKSAFADRRDRALGKCAIEAFFGKTVKYDRNDAVNALHYYFAMGTGKGVESMSDVWFQTDPGYTAAATGMIDSLHYTMPEVLDEANTAADAKQAERDEEIAKAHAAALEEEKVASPALVPEALPEDERLARMAGITEQVPVPAGSLSSPQPLGPPAERVAVASMDVNDNKESLHF